MICVGGGARLGVGDLRHRSDRRDGGLGGIRSWIVWGLRVRGQNRKPLRHHLRAKCFGEQHHQQRGVGEVEGLRHVALDDQRIDRSPGLGLVAEQREHRRQLVGRLRLGDAVVHALRVSVDGLARTAVWRHGAEFPLRGPQQAELQLEAVAVEGRLADDLGQSTLALPAQEVHLEQPEPGVQVADGEEEVVVGVCDHVRGAVLFQRDRHRLPKAGEVQRVVLERRVQSHGPCAGRRIECGTEGGEGAGAEERHVQQRGRHHQRGGGVEGAQTTLHRRGQV